MLYNTTEPHIVTNNQPALNISNEFVQDTQAQNLPTTEEVIAIMTAYNAGANMTPRRISKTGIYGSTPVTSVTRDVDESVISAVYTSPPPCDPPSVL